MNGVSMNNQSDGLAAGGFGLNAMAGADGDYTEEERAQMAEVERAQDEMRRKLYEKQMEEHSQKEQRKRDGAQSLQQWQADHDASIAQARQRNAQAAEEEKSRADEAKATSNPWQRVVDNCEMDPEHYAGDKDVTRLRQAMVARKADLNKRGGV